MLRLRYTTSLAKMAKLHNYMVIITLLATTCSQLPTLSLCQTTNSTGKETENSRCKSVTCCGIPGTPGRNGIPGHTGPQGPSGPPGRNGLNGIPGTKGDKGDPGESGRRGKKGIPGAPGTNGTDGIPGWRGKEGPRGMRGAIGPPGPTGAKGEPGNPGQQGPPGTERILRVCNCQWNVPTQVFYVNSGHWISQKTMVGFQDVTSANGEFHVKVVAPVTYVLHVGGDWVNDDSVTLFYRLRCVNRRRTAYIPNETGHRIYKFKEENRLESETFTHVTTAFSHHGRWRCQLQISKGVARAFYRWDSQYGEISLTMW